jgi:L-2-hydroxyglutarate oxidase LhgO
MLKREEIREIEPHAGGSLWLHSPGTGIIDFADVARTMAQQFTQKGWELKTGHRAILAKKDASDTVIETSLGAVRATFVINCGGLYSDEIARKMGIEPRVRIVPFRGEYCFVRDSRRLLVRNLIYPVPVPDLPFLGVHFTRTIDGKLEAGPNAVLALAREGYRGHQFHAGEFFSMLGDAAFWKMIFKYWKTGIFECYRAMSKKTFARELRKLVPEITEEDLVQGPTGVRAQCIDEKGSLVNDFKIVEGPGSLHVLNVPSPAATSSLAIADYIVNLVQKALVLK